MKFNEYNINAFTILLNLEQKIIYLYYLNNRYFIYNYSFIYIL